MITEQVMDRDWITENGHNHTESRFLRFINSKAKAFTSSGFSVRSEDIHPMMMAWQNEVTRWGIRKGRAAFLEGAGLGKTFQELEWGTHVHRHTQGDLLMLAPLVVAEQTHFTEGPKFGYQTTLCRSQSDVKAGINITNYEMLDKFDPAKFSGVILDESGILKHHDSSTRNALIQMFERTAYKLCGSATPAPNDYTELGNHAEFLGVMTRTEMLSMFFVHDGEDTSSWRLKGHAETEFWKWVCSWAVVVRKPSDLGYPNTGYDLPPIHRHQITVPAFDTISIDALDVGEQGSLIPVEASTMNERRGARRDSIEARANEVARLVNNSDESWIVWCGLNDEASAAEKAIPGSVEVAGSHSRDYKFKAIQWLRGELCICNDPLFRAKLAKECQTGNRNTSKTENKRSPLTQSTPLGSLTTKKVGPQKKTRSTCGSGTPQTSIESKRGPRSNETETTPIEEPNTQQTRLIASSTKPNQESTVEPTKLLSQLTSASETTGSFNQNTKPLCQDRTEPALYVDLRDLEIKEDFHSTSTTVIQHKEFVGCYAPTVILESENSKTIHQDSKQQQCTCGHSSGRRVLISKGSIFGWGCNIQQVHKWVHFGLSDSFEEMYQIDRRSWRFGQQHECHCYVVTSELEGAVVRNIERKERDFDAMNEGMVAHMRDEMNREVHGLTTTSHKFESDIRTGDGWTAILGDSVEELRKLPENSVHYSIFSPPFASLYTYSASDRDLGNCKDSAEFMKHFAFIVEELYRVMMPGRLISFHCMNMPSTIERDGFIGLTDFRGDLIRMFLGGEAYDIVKTIDHLRVKLESVMGDVDMDRQSRLKRISVLDGMIDSLRYELKNHTSKYGFIFHSEVVIWKDPLVAATRTHALGLAHKQIVKDAAMCRQGISDFLVTMRKTGKNPEAVEHKPRGFERYIGEDAAPAREKSKNARDNKFSHEVWQRYASPVWMDINASDTLQRESAREEKDERHICPLQLQVIERGIELWTNPGDMVLDPFGGIGSTGYVAVKNGRRAICIELKRSYWEQMYRNLGNAANASQTSLPLLDEDEDELGLANVGQTRGD